MKTKLHFSILIFLISLTLSAQQTAVNLSMGPGYINDVYYEFDSGNSSAFERASWDLAFLRTSAYAFSIRVNDGAGITVYDVSNNPSDWNTVDIANESTWTKLQNDETNWYNGAFDSASADGTMPYGWGNYNIVNHHIEGDVVFVLKYADNSFVKFFCEDFYNGYTFKYAAWNGSDWAEDTQVVLPNSENPEHKFNYYSLKNNQAVVAAPEMDGWDLKFTRYETDYFGDGSLYYPVTGVLMNSNITVAVNEETNGMPDNLDLEFSEKINTIGWTWKSFTNGSFTTDSNKVFYVKDEYDTVYRLYFTAFAGSSSGDLSYSVEDVTALLSSEGYQQEATFGIYTDASLNKTVNVIYNTKGDLQENSIAIYTTSGRCIYKSKLENKGFHNKPINLSSFANGVYLCQFKSGNTITTKKFVLN